MTKNILFYLTLILTIVSCKQEDITPSWMKINKFEVTTTEETQGSNSDGITDAWVFMDGQAIGTFELPCIIPILDDGEHTFSIFAGIKNNGISSTRIRYPFYEIFEFTGSLNIEDTLEITPQTAYKADVQFSYIEDFEAAGISLVTGPSSDTQVVFIDKDDYPEIVKYGEKCGAIFLGGSDSLYTGITAEEMVLPRGQQVYMEIDYRNNNSLTMGVGAKISDGSFNQHTPLVLMNPQETGEEVWKKIYIDLTLDVSSEISAVSYEVFFLSVLDDAIVDANIYIDNIKVVHY